MGIFKTRSFLDFELSPPFLFIIITSTFSLLVQSTKTIVHNEYNINPNSTITSPPQPPLDTTPEPKLSPFRPSITVFVGILTIIVCFTFLILLYAKHCRGGAFRIDSNHYNPPSSRIDRINSGVERTVVESLPTFRFKSLRGQKDGLECAVCLNRFEPTEVLRLLPKCKHAFHVECLDTWLDIHSTCPLCRYRVHPEDILLVDRCISGKNSSSGGSGNILFGGVQAPPTPPPLPPLSQVLRGGSRDGVQVSRHSSPGERGSSSSLEIIVEQPGKGKRKSTTSLISSKRSLDGWKSFSKKPSRLSGTKSLDISNDLRKDGLLLDSKNNSIVVEHGVEQFLQPRQGEGSSGGGLIRHSSAGECGSSSLLKVIAEKQIQNQNQRSNSTKFFSNARKSFDGWRSSSKKSSCVKAIPSPLSGTRSLDCDSDRRRKDGLLLLAEKKAKKDEAVTEEEHHRLDHMIIIGGPEERWSDVQPSEMLYLQTEMILCKTSILGQEGGRSRSSDDSKVINVNDRSVSEMTGLSRFRNDEEQQRHNNNGRDKRQSDNVRGAVSRWKAWISKSKSESVVQQPSSSGVDASASTSTNV